MKFDVITLFPNMFESPLSDSILKKAIEKGLLEVELHQLRDFSDDPHKTVDDRPYGGGAGMVLKPEPLARAIKAIEKKKSSLTILLTPQGKPLKHNIVKNLAGYEQLILVCSRYEGVDERIRERYIEEEISIGDYVVTGGEFPAMILIDAVSRMIPGVLGNSESVESESFSDGYLEYPHYTRPENFEGLKAPDVLLSGNHKEIEKWRREKSIERTKKRRPDLIEK